MELTRPIKLGGGGISHKNLGGARVEEFNSDENTGEMLYQRELSSVKEGEETKFGGKGIVIDGKWRKNAGGWKAKNAGGGGGQL